MRTPLLIGASKRSKFAHIPPGHDPGPQTLRTEVGFPLWGWFTGVVGTGMFVSGVFVAVGGRGSKFDPLEEALGGTFFALIGLMCALWGYSQLRKHRPPSLANRMPGAALAVDRDDARRGEKLTVTLTVPRSGSPEDQPLEVGVVCVERYDYQATAQTRAGLIFIRQTREANAHEDWRQVERTAGDQTVDFELPRDVPYSYEGDCVSYAWRVSARVARKLRSDPRIDHAVWVLP